MEITATQIAKKQIREPKPLDQIKVWGALIDYCSDIGECFLLQMDFLTHESTVKKLNATLSVTEAVTYVIEQLR